MSTDKEPGIIRSIIDTDLYKLTMQQAICKLFPREKVRYKFINRNSTKFPDGFDLALRKEISKMEGLALTKEEKEFLKNQTGKFLTPVYLDFLAGYRFDSSEVGVMLVDGDLHISIEGFWYRTVLWEVPLMALVSELYFKMTGQEPHDRVTRQQNNCKKMQFFYMNNMKIMEFGTRRRFSFENQLEVCSDLKSIFGSDKSLLGTSNPYIGMLLGLKIHGTHAHEWFMFMGARYGFKMANIKALEHWSDVYQGDLGIALTDTYTTDEFFKGFDKKSAKLYDGVRWDSGDAISFITKSVNRYEYLNIDPSTKAAVFTDSLNCESALAIHQACQTIGKGIRDSYGIGTFLSNDVGVKPLNIVIKMTAAQAIPDSNEWIPTVKLSDSKGKHTGDEKTVQLCLDTLNIKESKEAQTV